MKHILEQLNPSDRGLLLFDMPTGSGKTYSIADYIATHIDQLATKNRKIVYITPLKKNFPIDEIQQHLADKGKSDRWLKEVIVVEPTEELFTRYLDKELEEAITFSLPEYNTFNLASFSKYSKNEKGRHPDSQELLKEEARKLARHIKNALQFSNKTDSKGKPILLKPEERLTKIKNEEKWQWVGKLFPASLTDDKSVIIMSVSKAVYPYNTLIHPIKPLTELLSKYDVQLVIDEFDSSKRFLQNYIINHGVNTAIEQIPLVSQISSRLRDSCFPKKLLPTQVLKKQPVTATQAQEFFREKSDAIVEQFSLNLSIKMLEHSERSAFLFHDIDSYHLVDARRKKLLLNPDEEQNTLWINKCEFSESTEGESLSSLLASSNNFIQYFKSVVAMTSKNYFYAQQTDGATFDTAVNSYLDFFHLPESTTLQLIDEIRLSRLRIWRDDKKIACNNDKNLPEVRLYEKGFVHHTIADSEDHVGRSKIYTNSFPCTAELLMLDWCRHFMVIGVSATAKVPSILGNYDVKYIEKSLKLDAQADDQRVAKIHHISESETTSLYAHFEKSISGYSNVNIHVKSVDNPFSKDIENFEIIEELTQIIGDKEFVEYVLKTVRNKNPDSYQHELNQLWKICKNWRYYLDNNITAFLLLFGKSYKEKELVFVKKVLAAIAENHPTRSLSEDEVNQEIQSIFGKESDEQLSTIQESLAQGERRFVLSTYATIGAGKNIQYEIPDGHENELVKTNKFTAGTTTDFDAIYMDKPTNVMVWTGNPNFTQVDLANNIFELEYLKIAGLSRADFSAYLNKAFHAFAKNPNHWANVSGNIYQLPSYRLHVMQILIQAIGRICRTNMKSPQIHVCFDERISETWVEEEELGDSPRLPEFKKLNAYITTEIPIPEAPEHEMDNTQINIFIMECIKAFGLGTATAKMVEEWQRLRDIVLKAPMTKQLNSQYKALYVIFAEAQSRYAYLEENDYQYVEILNSKSFRAKRVSADDIDIAEMMKYDFIKAYFNDKGYATEFTKAKNWLSPIVYNNIYKGALGEEVGKCLWKHYKLPPLHELPVEQFEQFDYRVNESVYIDFKHWKFNRIYGDAEREKIYAKMDKVGAKLVFVINILERAEGLLDYFQAKKNGKTIIEVPSFIDSDTKRLEDIARFQQLIEVHSENK